MNAKITVQIDEDLRSIIPGFLERRKSEITGLRQALSDKDFSKLQTIGHNLKGSAGGYGFDLLGQLGATIESGSKEKNEAKIAGALNAMEDYLNNIDIIYRKAA